MQLSSLTVALAITALAGGALADPPRAKHAKRKPAATSTHGPGKGFWKVLVQPKAKWTLYYFTEVEGEGRPDDSPHPGPITVETYDVRKIGDADVARLRWTQGDSKDSPLIGTQAPSLDQFAVTSAGLYILKAEMTDAQIAEALKGKPSRSDPPKPYAGTKLNQGRFLRLRDDLVCMGEGPTPGAPDCEDVCEGAVCISATDGIVRLEGNWAPDMFDYEQKPKK